VTNCILALLFDGLASSADACEDWSEPARIVDEVRLRWAGRHFSREVKILRTFSRLLALGVADTYHEGAQAG
jgi:hypothetical protein